MDTIVSYSMPSRSFRRPGGNDDTYLYTLDLSGGFWYVGTTKNPARRLDEHRRGKGATWTKAHRPVGFSSKYPMKVLSTAEHSKDHDTRLQEDAQVKKVMLEQGIDKVRGGSYSRKIISRQDLKVLCKELFHANNGCLRCGRKSHWAKNCRATTDVCGNPLAASTRRGGRKRKEAYHSNSSRRRGGAKRQRRLQLYYDDDDDDEEDDEEGGALSFSMRLDEDQDDDDEEEETETITTSESSEDDD